MHEPPKDYDKSLDLHSSEWGEAGKRQPVFGSNAGVFFFAIAPTLIALWFLARILNYLIRLVL